MSSMIDQYINLSVPYALPSIDDSEDNRMVFFNRNGSVFLELKSPEFGDVDYVDLSDEPTMSAGGVSYSTITDPHWPIIRRASFTITGICDTDIGDIKSLFGNMDHTLNYFVDHLNRHWVCFIVDNNTEFAKMGKNNNSFSFEIQGEIIPD